MTYKFPGLKFSHSIDEVAKFIALQNSRFDGLLGSWLNYPRVVALHDFYQCIKHLDIAQQEHVGVFSGSLNEPELKLIESNKITMLNFEDNHEYDLDHSWFHQTPMNFSLSLCNQVFEHIFNPHVALKNIIHHTRNQGYIYISIPTINCIHSDPYFYSSGFHPRFLERLAFENDLIPIMMDQWGSFKYMVNAVSGKWLTSTQLKPGIHGLRDLVLPFSIFEDGRKESDRYITDCWGLFQKR